MKGLARAVDGLGKVNDLLLRVGRSIAWMCVVVMVLSILLQVFFRYVLNNPLAWSEEVARIFMLWMTACAAPTAYRYAGFVSIDMIRDALPGLLRKLLTLALLIAALLVLLKLCELSFEFFQRGFRTKLASIWYPVLGTGEDGSFGIQKWQKVTRAWVYLSMPVLFVSLTLVNIELLLREIGRSFGNEEDFPVPESPVAVVQE